MSKKQGFQVNVGSSSLLVIFVTLCLVSFAALSIVSARADYNLSQKVVAKTAGYYDAVENASAMLSGLDEQFYDTYNAVDSAEAYLAALNDTYEYTFPVSDTQSLYVSVSPTYPVKGGDSFYRVNAYKLITVAEFEYSETLNVAK